MKLEPRRLEGLTNMPPPIKAADLQQFLCAENWMRQCIPEFNKIINPLTFFLETIYKKIGKRTKKLVNS